MTYVIALSAFARGVLDSQLHFELGDLRLDRQDAGQGMRLREHSPVDLHRGS